MVLATASHHSFDRVHAAYGALRGQTTATKTGEEGGTRQGTTRYGDRSPPPLPVCGSRPASLAEPRRGCGAGDAAWQQEVWVPQVVDQLTDAFRSVDSPMAEQVTAVPKISCLSRAGRTVLREPQMVEQLVKVPTVLGLLDRRQSSSAWSRASFSRFFSQNRIQQRVDVPVPGGGLHVPLPAPGASSAVSRDELGQGVFSHLSAWEKVRRSPGVRVRGCTRT